MTKKPFIKQEVFDYVLNFLRKQGRPSMASDSGVETCAYRGDGGLKCAVGCLIPDEVMVMELNGNSVRMAGVVDMLNKVYSDIYTFDNEGFPFYGDNLDFLEDLQSAHDGSLGTGDLGPFLHHMQGIARKHNLIYTEPK